MNTEKKILTLLKENSRYTNEYLAKKVGVSEGTIRNKIKKLVEEKKIKKFTIKTKYDARAICMIMTNTKNKTSNIIKKIEKIKGIEEIFEVSGKYTIICKIEGELLSELNEIVENIRLLSGVVDTETYTVLNEIA
jgi:Lrp/AsnC family transcriptional regulator of lysine biosynthesis